MLGKMKYSRGQSWCLLVRSAYMGLGTHSSRFAASVSEVSANPAVPSTSSENSAVEKDVLDRIVSSLGKLGQTVILNSRSSIPNPVTELLRRKADPDRIVDFFSVQPDLLTSQLPSWSIFLGFMTGVGCDVTQCLEMLAGCPELLDLSREHLKLSMDAFRTLGLNGSEIVNCCCRCPALLLRSPHDLISLVHMTRDFFSSKQIHYVLTHHPDVLLMDFEELEAKYEYMFFAMGVDQPQIKKCNWYKCSLEYIQLRHEFLMRTGRYVQPNPKRPLLSQDNPKLEDILESAEKVFAEEIGKVTLEEFLVFKKMYLRQLADEAREKEADEDGDDQLHESDSPYETLPDRQSITRFNLTR